MTGLSAETRRVTLAVAGSGQQAVGATRLPSTPKRCSCEARCICGSTNNGNELAIW